MKRTGFFFLAFFSCLSAYSQVDGNYSYSVGLKGYSILQMPKMLNQTNSQRYETVYLNGIIAKFNDNQINYRVNANYLGKSMTFYNSCRSCEVARGTRTDYSFKIGFEKNINYARVQPYFGSDIGIRISSFDGEIRTRNAKSNKLPYNVDTDKTGFILSPILGIKYTPIRQVSVFAESNVDFYYSYERQESIEQDVNNTRTFTSFNKWEFLLNPISFGILIHLVDKN
ncbi:MAG: hypothetical protein EOO90_16120 [Pedobacter sp.]|nr:MAG: hypothetical protein EOO90_16120 [Pedobacter sp.]